MINRRKFISATALVGSGAAMMIATPTFAERMKAATGMFEGRSNHVTMGTVSIIEEDGRRFIELGDDFSLDSGPDPRVALGKDGTYDPDSKLGALLSYSGKQRYALPPTLDLASYNEVVIWCDVASVPLGVAKIQ
ncbi:Electron transfer DM13 [Shimia gijangensis]|uniref:Electron transfer DM13 n=1 Tax=Shimia gijangensis TaxID=1470563 RepID=A0A1M6MTC4_9RHOB|nr:DM13 domain-containing protein [Shimia gijangensis]SHJ86640.1 Electron transfer DM13 [Shimia gijangensis]